MPSSRLSKVLFGAMLPGVFASGCLVTFNDYPTGELRPEAGASTGGSGGSGGISSAGSDGKGGSSGGSVGGSGATANLSLMIDDFEDGNVTLLPAGDRSGSWYMSNDGEGMQMPYQNTGLVALLDPPRGSSERALHTSGSGFDVWGALVRADFNVQVGTAEAYDVSTHTGVKLWARSNDQDTYRMRVQIATPLAVEGGDHFGTTIEAPPEWQEFILPFSEMTQEGFGGPGDQFELEQALGVQMSFGRGEDFDVWIDDVSFF